MWNGNKSERRGGTRPVILSKAKDLSDNNSTAEIPRYARNDKLNFSITENGIFRTVALLLLLALPLVSSSGKVFLNRFLAHGQAALDTTAAWQKIYECPVIINSSRGMLSVYGCDEPLEEVMAKLNLAFPQDENNAVMQNQNMGWVTCKTCDQLLRLQILAMPETGKSVIFAIEQTQAEFAKSAEIPKQSSIFSPRSFPRAKLTSLFKNEESGTTLETMLFNALPDETAGNIAEELSRCGWQMIFPLENPTAAGTRFFVFKSSAALCAVTTAPALRENKTCVTFLHKEIKD